MTAMCGTEDTEPCPSEAYILMPKTCGKQVNKKYYVILCRHKCCEEK